MTDEASEDSRSEPGGPPAPVPQQRQQAGLVLVSTPIGNLGDMSARGVEALRQASLILCEDTRVTAKLLRHFGISGRMVALHDHNEAARIPEILGVLRDGATVTLVSDAGTPLLSDPGYRLVRAAIEADLPVTATPGANAALMALTLSGLPPHPYLFAGFLPPRAAARQAALAGLRAAEQAGLAATLVFYESPHRTAETLAAMALVFGPRPAAVARELTKLFEEVRRDTLPALAAYYEAQPPRGEICIVVGPAPEEGADGERIDAMLKEALSVMSVREAAASVAEASGVSRKEVYRRALTLAQGREESSFSEEKDAKRLL